MEGKIKFNSKFKGNILKFISCMVISILILSIIHIWRNKKCIEDHFDKSIELELELEKNGKSDLLELVRDISDMVDIHYIRQKEPKGLGHAIHCAKTFVGNEPFAVLLGDDVVDSKTPCLKQLIEDVYKRQNITINTWKRSGRNFFF